MDTKRRIEIYIQSNQSVGDPLKASSEILQSLLKVLPKEQYRGTEICVLIDDNKPSGIQRRCTHSAQIENICPKCCEMSCQNDQPAAREQWRRQPLNSHNWR